jgi:hypothetical protein
MNPIRAAVLACLYAGTVITSASGSDLFVLNVQGNGQELTAGSNNVINLTRDLVDTRNEFSQFEGVEFNASLRYAGVDDAILYHQSADGQTVTVQLLGQEPRTFSAADGDLEDQVVDYLRRDGMSDVRGFFREINRRSIVAVSDGNPLATTARNAEYTFHRFGQFADLTGWERRRASEEEEFEGTSGFRFRIDALAGAVNTDVGNGFMTGFAISTGYHFNRRVGIVFALPTGFHSIEGANTVNIAAHLAVPVRIVAPTETNPVNWQLTPSAVVAVGASYDMAAGGIIWGGGLTSALSYDITRRLTIAMANQITVYEGQPLRYGDYKFDPGISQQILKNGLKLTQGLGETFYLYAGASYTNFLQDAAVDNYWSPSAGAGLRTRAGTNLMLGYQGDFGSGYEAHMGRLSVHMPF